MSDKKTLADVADKTVDAVMAAANKISEAAPEVWAIAVRQQRIEGIVDLCAIVISWLFCYAVYRLAKSQYNPEIGFLPNDNLTPAFWLTLICGVATLGSVIITFMVVPDSVVQIVNPEYYAAIDILSRLK